MGSQQMLGLPTERPYESNEDFETLNTLNSKNRYEKASTESEKQYHTAITERLRDTRYVDGENSHSPNTFVVFALQAPIMLPTLTVVACLTRRCPVVFGPPANEPACNDDAKVHIYSPRLMDSIPICGADRSSFALLNPSLLRSWSRKYLTWSSTTDSR